MRKTTFLSFLLFGYLSILSEMCEKSKATKYIKNFNNIYPELVSLEISQNQQFIVGCRITPNKNYVLLNPGSYSLKIVSLVRDSKEVQVKIEDECFSLPVFDVPWCKMSAIDFSYAFFPEFFSNTEFKIPENEIIIEITKKTKAAVTGTCKLIMKEKEGNKQVEVVLEFVVANKCMNITYFWREQISTQIREV